MRKPKTHPSPLSVKSEPGRFPSLAVQTLGSSVCLILALVLGPGLLGAAGPRSAKAAGAAVLINEVCYDPVAATSESSYEWVELYNPGAEAVNLVGWHLADARSSDELPDLSIAPGELVIVAGGKGFAEEHPDFAGRVIALSGAIGNGLGNSGDQVRLLDADGVLVDGMSYGEDRGLLDPAPPDVASGHSLERIPAGADSDSAADWRDQETPTPGEAVQSAPLPATATTAPEAPTSPAPGPVPGGSPVVLNEYLPAPKAIDWDGDGTASGNDEWVELYNGGEVTLDLRGWQLDDQAGGGSAPFVLAEGSQIGARGFLLLFKKATKLSLNNDTDSVRLLRPDGSVADETSYTKTVADGAYARSVDGTGPWTDTLSPSPGKPNAGAEPAGGERPQPGTTPTATPTNRPASGTTPTSTPRSGAGTPTPASSGQTPAATSEPGGHRLFLPLLISEVLFNPVADGNDFADEWVELFNRSSAAVALGGWSLGDGTKTTELPDDLIIPAGDFLVVTATERVADALNAAGIQAAPVGGGRIGNGLANGGDVVRLRGPTGELADAVSYGDNLVAFDPAVPLGPPGVSIERLPPDVDSDRAEDWWLQPAPSPGRAGLRQGLEGEVRLNEVLPAPRRRDWNADGRADHEDEWVELVNRSNFAVDLGDWLLVSTTPERAETIGTSYRVPSRAGERTDWTYRMPAGLRIAPGGYLVLHRAVTRLGLANGGGALLLVRADTVVADRFTWRRSPGYDGSWCRSVDGEGVWVADYAVTPGEPNHPLPTADPSEASAGAQPAPTPINDVPLVSLADARRLPRGRHVRTRGWVTAAAGQVAARSIYLGDGEAGLQIWMTTPFTTTNRRPDAMGASLEAEGVIRDYHGERELVISGPDALRPWDDQPGFADPADPPNHRATPNGGLAIPSLGPDRAYPIGLTSTGPDSLGGLRTGPSITGRRRALSPLSLSTGALTETVEGRLVELKGRLVRRTGPSLILDDGSGIAVIILPPGRTILPSGIRRGSSLTVRGIVGQYAFRSPWIGGYRLRVRDPGDVRVRSGRPAPTDTWLNGKPNRAMIVP